MLTNSRKDDDILKEESVKDSEDTLTLPFDEEKAIALPPDETALSDIPATESLMTMGIANSKVAKAIRVLLIISIVGAFVILLISLLASFGVNYSRMPVLFPKSMDKREVLFQLMVLLLPVLFVLISGFFYSSEKLKPFAISLVLLLLFESIASVCWMKIGVASSVYPESMHDHDYLIYYHIAASVSLVPGIMLLVLLLFKPKCYKPLKIIFGIVNLLAMGYFFASLSLLFQEESLPRYLLYLPQFKTLLKRVDQSNQVIYYIYKILDEMYGIMALLSFVSFLLAASLIYFAITPKSVTEREKREATVKTLQRGTLSCLPILFSCIVGALVMLCSIEDYMRVRFADEIQLCLKSLVVCGLIIIASIVSFIFLKKEQDNISASPEHLALSVIKKAGIPLAFYLATTIALAVIWLMYMF